MKAPRMLTSKLFPVVACLAMAGLMGCASGPQQAPNGMNLYLEPEFDNALLSGINKSVDLSKLVDVSLVGAVSQADQYAVELVSTTQFGVIRDAFLKVKNLREGEDRLGRSMRWYDLSAKTKISGATRIEKFNQIIKTLPVSEFVDAQVTLGTSSRDYFVSTGSSPLRTQQATISGAWQVIGYAKDSAENIRLGRAPDNPVSGVSSGGYFYGQGCYAYADRAVIKKMRSEATGGGTFEKLMQIQTAPSVLLENMGTTDDNRIWSEKRCAATYEAVPGALAAYKQTLKK